MKHFGTKQIETERLILRPFRFCDAGVAFKNWMNSDTVTKYLTWNKHETIDDTKQILKIWVDNYKDLSFYQWAIIEKSSLEPIGSISVVDIRVVDNYNEMEIGYCLGESFWNKGIMKEALNRVIQFLFEEVEVEYIIAKHDVENIASGAVMRSCGLTLQKQIKSDIILKNGIRDMNVYVIYREEYIKNKY